MRASKYLFFSAMLTASLFLTQCEIQHTGCTDPRAKNYDVSADIDDGSCVYGADPTVNDCISDITGNLSVTNQTDQILYLYRDFALITCIPANAENFIVNIPNQNLSVCKLQIWKSSNVDDIYNPSISNVYRQWSVALSNTTEVDERANWLITGSDSYTGSGTLELTYPDTDDYGQQVIYQVDVFLNSKDGARLASLQPGISTKKVSVDYGVHYLYFRYWYSDPNSTSGDITEIGWGQQNDIVINAEHESTEVLIPFYYSNIGKYGELKIYNETDKIISIYANDALIETIAKIDGSTQGLSIIPAQDYTTFLIPVNTYIITAKSVDGSSSVISFKGTDIVQNETAVKRIGPDHQTISLTNNTGETVLLYSTDEEYLGVALAPGESSGSVPVPSAYDSLVVFNGDKSKFKKFAAGLNVSISELEGYMPLTFDITVPWNSMGENGYQSPAIGDKTSTDMQASLSAPNAVTFSFEYKVSSELNYDFFSFSIDGITQISRISGEVDWTTFSIELAAGNHIFQWLYTKDDMFFGGNDNVEIRNITVN